MDNYVRAELGGRLCCRLGAVMIELGGSGESGRCNPRAAADANCMRCRAAASRAARLEDIVNFENQAGRQIRCEDTP